VSLYKVYTLNPIFFSQHLSKYEGKDKDKHSGENEEAILHDIFLNIRSNVNEMKSIADDISTVQTQRTASPRIIDQAKTFTLTVQG